MQWRKIKGFPNYSVSDTGLVRNDKTGRILKQVDNGRGYLAVSFYRKGNTPKLKCVHQLVAKAFIENPENKLTVDHINRDKTDNRVENLRWATHEEQQANRRNPMVPILAIKGGIELRFSSISECGRELGLPFQNISKCLLGERHTCGGYTFRRLEE